MPVDAPPFMADEATLVVDSLLQAGASGTPVALPPGFAQHCTLEQALALQAQHAARLIERMGGRVIGLKLGGTTAPAMQALGLSSPFTGPIFSARHHPSGARVARRLFHVCVIEAEIGVRIARDLGPFTDVPSREELLDAIDEVYPCIEIADSRLTNWATASASEIVTDLGYAGAWVQGLPQPGWRTLDLRTLAVTLSCDGQPVRTGSGALVLGDPLHALGVAIADLGRRGQALRAGTLVSTGTCTAPWPTAGGGHIEADFGPLGRVVLDLDAPPQA